MAEIGLVKQAIEKSLFLRLCEARDFGNVHIS
jgi:hypothetical protein